MSQIIASHVPTSVSKEKLENFFSFCGQVTLVSQLTLDDPKFNSFEVKFASPKALLTALLLNDAELDGLPIQVKEDKGGDLEKAPAYDHSQAKDADDNKIQSTVTGDKNYDDVDQEEKPKYAIMAQLLANGYIIGDNIIQQALEQDKKNGYLAKFKNFLTQLDEKYVHSSDPDSLANQKLKQGQETWEAWQKKYGPKISQYLQQAASSPYGVKIHEFYQNVANNVQEVYKEAQRLVELKKGQQHDGASSDASGAAAGSGTGATTLSLEKPGATSSQKTA